MRRLLILLGAGLLALAGVVVAASGKPSGLPPGAVPLSLQARPIPNFRIGSDRRHFGQLDYRGGLELTGNGDVFGGISGLSLTPDGTGFTLVSDAGLWVTGRFQSRNGRLSGVSDVALAPMLDRDGQTLLSTDRGDTESLAMASDGHAYVGVERTNEILRFDLARGVATARGRPVALPAATADLPFNRGFEAIGIVPKGLPASGAIVAISERSSETGPTTKGFLIGGPVAGTFEMRRTNGFDITDLAFLPNRDMLVLERRYSLLRGVAMRIRRIPGTSLLPGAVLDGPAILEAGLDHQIDNMEALAVSRGADGRTELTVMSDNNFSFFQRTIVLRFALAEGDG